MSEREEKLQGFFAQVDERQRCIINGAIREFVFIEEQLSELKKLPFIRVNSGNRARQEQTEAARLFIKLEQAYMNVAKYLSAELRRSGGEKDDDFDKFLAEYKDGM